MIRLVGRNISPFVRRTAIALRHFELPYEPLLLSTVDHRLELREFNPLARVPSLVLDDGTVLIDSSAIIDYLDDTYGDDATRLIPAGGAARRRVLQLTAVALGTAEKAVASFYESTRRPAELVYRGWIEQCDEQCSAGLLALEAAAGDRWLCGDRLSVADITTFCALEAVRRMNPAALAGVGLRALEAHHARCLARPAFAP